MLDVILFCVMAILFLWWVWSRRKFYAIHRMLKNESWCPPIIGNTLDFIGSDIVRMEALKRFGRYAIKQGGLTSLWIGPRYFIMVAEANAAEILLRKFLEKDDIMMITKEIFGEGSIIAPVHTWRRKRKVASATFSVKNLNAFVEVFSRQSSIMVTQMKEVAGKGTVSIWKYLTSYTMDSVCETALGTKVEAQLHNNHPFLVAFDQHLQLITSRILLPLLAQKMYTFLPIWKKYMAHIYVIWDFCDASPQQSMLLKKQDEATTSGQIHIHDEVSLWERANMPGTAYNPDSATGSPILRCSKDDTEEEPVFKCILELYMESSKFNDKELREECLVLLLAGTDTSAVNIGYTCLMIARHPEVQQKVYEEVKELLGDSDRQITPADLPRLKYLEAVIKESMRLYPPVPVIVRKADSDFELPSGLTIVKDTALMVNIWALHRNPAYWGDDADEFRPERFLGENKIYPNSYMPFSSAPRGCLGYQYAMMSVKVAISKIIQNYRLLPASHVKDCNAPLRVKFEIMMKDVDNYELQLESRK